MFDHEMIKKMVTEMGCTTADLLAMHPSRDPFYVGTDANIREGKWFAEVWRASGMHDEHLRAVHYWLVSPKRPEPYRLPIPLGWKDQETGENKTTDVYINNKRCWIFLLQAAMKARDLGLVDPDDIADQRSPAPELNANLVESDADYGIDRYDVDIPYLPNLPIDINLMPGISATVEAAQPYLVEIWIEKSTLDKMLVPFCKRYEVNLIVGQGFATATAIRSFLARAREADKPVRILYISDYDKKGRQMPPAVARRIEFYQRNDGFGDLDIALEPIALTDEQIQKYDLPRSPDDGESVELDAMKVNYPNELRDIIESAVMRYYDTGLQSKEYAAQSNLHERLESIRESVLEDHSGELNSLLEEYRGMASEINNALSGRVERFHEVRARLSELSDMMQEELREAIDENVNLYDYIPESYTDGDPDGLLYKSERDYITQLRAYKARQSKNSLDGDE